MTKTSRIAGLTLSAALPSAGVLSALILLTGCPSVPTPRTPSVRPQAGGAVVRPPPPGRPYTIREGDTLYSIARRHGVDWRDILEANPSLDPLDLRAGVEIVIPKGEAVGPEPGETGLPPSEPPEGVPENPGHPGPIQAEAQFVWPLRGQILRGFGQSVPWRMWTANNGIDIRGVPGQAVVAAKSGRVNTFASLAGFGKVVILEHTDGTVTFYGNNARLLVRHGTWVRQGEAVAIVGSTGLTNGTQLHFRIMRNEQHVNPLLHLPRL